VFDGELSCGLIRAHSHLLFLHEGNRKISLSDVTRRCTPDAGRSDHSQYVPSAWRPLLSLLQSHGNSVVHKIILHPLSNVND
jgi:hypothetical protein